MKKFALLTLTLLYATSAFGKDDLTETERENVLRTAVRLHQQCVTGLTEKLKQTPAEVSQVARLLAPEPQPYCECIRGGFVARMTPAIYRASSMAPTQQLVQSVSQECGVVEYKRHFPDACRVMIADIAKSAGRMDIAEQSAQQACGCMQKPINALSSKQGSAAINNTMQDYGDWRKSPDAFKTPRQHSTMGEWKICLQRAGLARN